MPVSQLDSCWSRSCNLSAVSGARSLGKLTGSGTILPRSAHTTPRFREIGQTHERRSDTTESKTSTWRFPHEKTEWRYRRPPKVHRSAAASPTTNPQCNQWIHTPGFTIFLQAENLWRNSDTGPTTPPNFLHATG
jgi:hypothetical protein